MSKGETLDHIRTSAGQPIYWGGLPTSTIPSSSSVSTPASLPSCRLDGGELSSDACVDARLSDRPILVCSADIASLREKAEELQRIGGVHILEKPFGVDEITDLVARLTSQRSSVTG